MRLRFLIVPLLIALAPQARADKPRKPKPPLAATQYPCHDTHAKDRVTIAAEPGDTPETAPATRLDYFHHGFMPMRVIVTNDSDKPVILDDARILFLGADDSSINAATHEELQRRMFSTASATGTRIPLPMPLPPITIHHPPVDKQILADDTDFGFKTTTVAPHTTVAGYLFYDTRDLDDPVLQNATLELRKVKFAGSTTYMDNFEILLKPTPGAKNPTDNEKTMPRDTPKIN